MNKVANKRGRKPGKYGKYKTGKPGFNKDGRVKLSALKKGQLSTEQITAIKNELEGYHAGNVEVDVFKLTVSGRGRTSKNYVYQFEEDIASLLKRSRKLDKKIKEVNRYREKYGVEEYHPGSVGQFLQPTSSRIEGITGGENKLATLDIILGKKTRKGKEQVNKIKRSAADKGLLEKVKYQAFVNPDDMLKKALPQFDISLYKTPKGKFISKSKEKELYKLFTEYVNELYDDGSPEKSSGFSNHLYEVYGRDSDSEEVKNLHTIIAEQGEKQLVEDYQEYVKEQLKKVGELHATGAQERFDYAIDPNEIEQVEQSLKERRINK